MNITSWPRAALLSIVVIGTMTAGVAWLLISGMADTGQSASMVATSTPTGAAEPCVGHESHYALHGTDCREMPIVTGPGELGPPSVGGPGGGDDWVPAYPGSNVWIPEHQISGRMFVLVPGSTVTPPDGFTEIGRAPDGSILYWGPDDPDRAIPAAPDIP